MKNLTIMRDGKEYTLTNMEMYAAAECVRINFMQGELEETYGVSEDKSEKLANEAYNLYASASNNFTEGECIDEIAGKYGYDR